MPGATRKPPRRSWITPTPRPGKTFSGNPLTRSRSGIGFPSARAINPCCPAEFLAQALPEGRNGLYFDNFEDVWRGLDADGRHDLARWLRSLEGSGLALLYSTQDELPAPLGQKVSLEALDGGAEQAETMPESEFSDLDSVKLFTHIYGEVSPPRSCPTCGN